MEDSHQPGGLSLTYPGAREPGGRGPPPFRPVPLPNRSEHRKCRKWQLIQTDGSDGGQAGSCAEAGSSPGPAGV